MSEYWESELSRHQEAGETAYNYACEQVDEELKDGKGSFEIGATVKVSEDFLAKMIKREVEANLGNKLTETIQNMINNEVSTLITRSYNQDKVNSFIKGTIEKVVEDRFEKRYPELVGEKIDLIKHSLKDYKFNIDSLTKRKSNYTSSTIQSLAESTIEKYLDESFKEVVEKAKNDMKEYAENYFARNLFKAMGFMDQMLPTDNKQIDK